MEKSIRFFVSSAMGSYILKLLADVTMYVFLSMKNSEGYNDILYLIVPHVVATVLIILFYTMFFGEGFFTWLFGFSTPLVIIANLIFTATVIYDRMLGYRLYFMCVAIINFINAHYLKVNVIPQRKSGDMEYGPMIFEGVILMCIILSAYSVFWSFPFYDDVAGWHFYNRDFSLKLNMFVEFVMIVLYYLCKRNRCEYIYDNILIDDEID